MITFYLPESYKSLETLRKKEEKQLVKDEKPLSFPDWDVLREERLEEKPGLWFTISDEDGNVIRKIEGPVEKGFHRVFWDLAYPARDAIDVYGGNSSGRTSSGGHVMPGTYSVSMYAGKDGKITLLDGPVYFEVKKLRDGVLKGMDEADALAFRMELDQMREAISAAKITLDGAGKKVEAMQKALMMIPEPPGPLQEELYEVKRNLKSFREKIYGDPARAELSEYDHPVLSSRLWNAFGAYRNITYGPTATQMMSLELARRQYEMLKPELLGIVNREIPALEQKLIDAGAPWMNGMPLK